jgi:hypothetical protein
MRWAVLLLTAAGCGRFFGLDSPQHMDAGDASTAVDGRDAASGMCLQNWQLGPQFGNPTPVANVNTGTGQERLPFLTSDGMQLYFTRDNDYYVATRSNPMGTFATPQPESSLSSSNNEGRVWISPDGARAFFSSNRIATVGGGANLWRGTRNSISVSWSVDQMYLDNVNGSSDENDPQLSDDMLHVYFSRKDMGIFYADRASITDQFSAGTSVAELKGITGQDDEPSLTRDELVIVFSSTRDGDSDLWYSTRTTITEPFAVPKPLTGVNSPNRMDTGPFVTPDGCALYFESDRGSSHDLYVAGLAD